MNRISMGVIGQPDPVLAIVAVFSRYGAAIEWARRRATALWGPIALASPAFVFTETDYYQPTMGAGLRKCFWAFERLVNPLELAAMKLRANAWEEEYVRLGGHAEVRPLNIDPGYLTSAKLVLASTKDHAHRLYLSEGIYAEVTLFFKDRSWQPREWTFPDYRRADYWQFFSECRSFLRGQLRSGVARPSPQEGFRVTGEDEPECPGSR